MNPYKAELWRRAKQAKGKVGAVIGVIVSAVVSWAVGVATLTDTQALVVLVAGGVVGYFLGEWVEIIWHRFATIPPRVIAELHRTLEEYRAGPVFVISLGDVTFFRFRQTPDGPPVGALIMASIRVTNTGQRGAALDWAVGLALGNGRRLYAAPLPFTDMHAYGHLVGTIARQDFIQERTASVMEHNDTAHGRYFGFLPLEVIDQVKGGTLHVWCKNYQGNEFRYDLSLTEPIPTGPPGEVPTLERLVFNMPDQSTGASSGPPAPGPSEQAKQSGLPGAGEDPQEPS